MGLVNKSDYIYAKLQDKALQITDELIELDDKEIIRLGLKSQDVLTVNIDHIEWTNTEPLETYEGTKASLPKINIYWDDETVTEASINYTMVDNVSYYLEPGNYELRAIYRDFTSTNTLPITVIKKELVSIEWENANPITTQQNHKAYLPYIKLNYNDGKYKRLSSQSPGVTLSDSEYYLELGEKTLTAIYKGFATNELTINVIEEEIIDKDIHDYSQDYLTIEALEDGIIRCGNGELLYSINNGEEWLTLNSNVNSILIYKYTQVLLKSTTLPRQITFSGKHNIKGNVLSIYYGDNFKNNSYSSIIFGSLFSGDLNLVSAKNLILPALQLANSCYQEMFRDCASLVTAPELPALQLADGCYGGMFNGCTSLTTAPELPALELADGCYSGMFAGCTSLTTAPELPALELANSCYQEMFRGCTSLTTAPELPATILTRSCYEGMFNGCTSLTTAPELPALQLADGCYSGMFFGCINLITVPELPATTLVNDCYSSMFAGCTSLTTAPELPATTLANACYSSMFAGCTSLTTAPELPATTLANACYRYMFSYCTSLTTVSELPALQLADYCYSDMFNGCISLTTAPELPALQLANSCYQEMFRDCASLVTAPELPALQLANSCYEYMFWGCSSLTTAPALPATTLATYCYYEMFSGCTSLTTAPELPAITLADYCYYGMFQGCTNLNYIKAMFTTTASYIYNIYINTENWVYGVAANGTFVKNAAATWNVTGSFGIPKDWTVQEIDPETGEIVNEYINE